MASTPKTQRALAFEQYAGDLIVQHVPVPEPADDELLIHILFSGICHTDCHVWAGDHSAMTKCPLIGGHEGAGVVVKVGSKVNGWRVGEKAGIKMMNHNCLVCEHCKKGNEPCCDHIANYGFNHDGTFQEYMTLRAVDVAKIDKNMDLAEAAPILCAGVTVYRALIETGVRAGEIVAINGASGGLGSLAVQYAKAMGMRVLALSRKEKEEHIRQLGAEWFVDAYNTPDIVKHITEIAGGGPHGVVSLAVGTEPLERAIEYVRKHGTVVAIALPPNANITVNTIPLILLAKTLKGSFVGSRLDTEEALAIAARGHVKIPIEIVKLEDVPHVYQRMLDGTITSRCVVDFSL